MEESFVNILQKLTGQKVALEDNLALYSSFTTEKLNLGYSQFNELLLSLGYDRISEAFFQFLADGTIEYQEQATINDFSRFSQQVDKAIELFLLVFGNIKFGYKNLSSVLSEEDFCNLYESAQPVPVEEYSNRHDPLIQVDKIANDDTYLLGYIIQAELKARLDANPADEEAVRLQGQMVEAIEKGKRNHKAYLASDHMDVYVATSMRQKHEYLFVSRITDEIFNHPQLQELRVRYFDPTQAYCPDRIDKGISEALMLKRASCTIYLAQETDTLGKDSELASTLAQGKTVIAYIPMGDKAYVDKLLKDLEGLNPAHSRKKIILDQLRIFDPDLCWTDKNLRIWIDTDGDDETYGLDLLYKVVQSKYDKRAKTLKDTHPLGVQVNLETGVANGVIVTREIDQCVALVRNVLLLTLNFKIEEKMNSGVPYVFLKEATTDSVYRVSSGEKLLSNAFWNYYLPK